MEDAEYRLAAVMFTDIVGFSRMMEEDETGMLSLLGEHNAIVRQRADEYRGRVIKTIGDAFMVEFSSTVNAVNCALAVQDSLAERNARSEGRDIVIRIGIHLGDIYFFEGDAFGEGINIASRLEGIASPGSVCVSQDVYRLVHNKIANRIVGRGAVELKNIQRDFQAYEIVPDSADAAVAGEPEDAGQTEGNEAAGPDPAFETLRRIALAHIKETRGQRMTVSDFRTRVAGRTDASAEEIDSVVERLERRALLRPDDAEARGPLPEGQSDDNNATEPASQPNILKGAALGQSSGLSPNLTPGAADQGLFSADAPLDTQEQASRYIETVASDRQDADTSFRSHLASFAGVNTGLVVLWSATGSTMPWFVFPLGGWFIAVASQWASVRELRRHSDALEHNGDADPEKVRALRELYGHRVRFARHAASSGATIAALAAFNAITTGFPWAVFPGAALASGISAHAARFFPGLKRLKETALRAGCVLPGRNATRKRGPLKRLLRAAGPDSPADTIVAAERQAAEIGGGIREQLDRLDENHPAKERIAPAVDDCVSLVRSLGAKMNEIEQVASGVSNQSLDRQLFEYRRKRERTNDSRLRREYDRSIDQLEAQKRSAEALERERHILTLRMNSVIGILKQMRVELARLGTSTAATDSEALHSIEAKTRELGEYLDDLREAEKELETLTSS